MEEQASLTNAQEDNSVESFSESKSSCSSDLLHEYKITYRLLRKNLSALIRKIRQKSFKEILFVTTANLPEDYILAFQKQYPDKKISVIVPLSDNNQHLGKPVKNEDTFLQNTGYEASLFKLRKTKNNIQIYGIFCDAFPKTDYPKQFNDIKYLAVYLKFVRIFARYIKPDIIHSDCIPFFLGAEFESKRKYPIKVFQTINDFHEIKSLDMFWAFLNIADKKSMQRLCRDKNIKQNVAALFKLPIHKNFSEMSDCLELIYKNYTTFRHFIKEDNEQEENILFRRLNKRVVKLFPQMKNAKTPYYNPMYLTLKKADFWAVKSKTYYNEIFDNSELTGTMYDAVLKTKNNSGFVIDKKDVKDFDIVFPFDVSNFREEKIKNKKYLLKEFNKDRIRTKFTDDNLFVSDEVKICGYLDSCYDAPLFFLQILNDIDYEGFDIAVAAILKMFELNKNIQIIINIPNGLENEYVKSFIDFCEKYPSVNGRWIFIDGAINTLQFLAASDMIMLPNRTNPKSNIYLDAIKFGCIPIASKCGIYNDSIIEIFDSMIDGCGFKTEENLLLSLNPNEFYTQTVLRALNFYIQNHSSWNILIKNCLNYRTDWDFKSIEKYNNIYEDLL